MPQEMEQLTQLGEEIKSGLHQLKKFQEQSEEKTSALVKGQIQAVADDLGTKFEELQQKQAGIEAVLQRTGGVKPTDQEQEQAKQRKDAFLAYVRNGCETRGLTDLQLKALSTDNLGSGGYLVTPEMMSKIETRVFETTPLRRVANVVKTQSKSIEYILDDDQAGGGWVGEGDSPSETSTPTLGKIEIVAKKLYAYPKITNEMLADASIDVEAWLVNKIADVLSRLENTAFVSGNGVSQPRGFLTLTAGSANYARGQIQQVVNGSTSAPTENGIINLIGSLKEAYQPRASLLMKRATFIEYLKLSGTNVFRFFNLQPSTGTTGQVLGSSLSLFDKPVILADDMPVIGANALSVAYGDFSVGYTIADRQAISMMRDPYTAPGFQKYYAEKRTGGDVTNYEAIKLLKFSAS